MLTFVADSTLLRFQSKTRQHLRRFETEQREQYLPAKHPHRFAVPRSIRTSYSDSRARKKMETQQVLPRWSLQGKFFLNGLRIMLRFPQGVVLFLEAAMMEPVSQVSGAVVIFDMDGLSLQQVWQFTPPFAKRIVDWLQVKFLCSTMFRDFKFLSRRACHSVSKTSTLSTSHTFSTWSSNSSSPS